MEQPCVICQIVRREKEGWIVRETETMICFLPQDLNAFAHTIIAPKRHVEDLPALPAEIAGDLMQTMADRARHYRGSIQADGFNVLHASGAAAQQSVMHLHFHLLPRFMNDGIDAWPSLEPLDVDRDAMLSILRGD